MKEVCSIEFDTGAAICSVAKDKEREKNSGEV